MGGVTLSSPASDVNNALRLDFKRTQTKFIGRHPQRLSYSTKIK